MDDELILILLLIMVVILFFFMVNFKSLMNRRINGLQKQITDLQRLLVRNMAAPLRRKTDDTEEAISEEEIFEKEPLSDKEKPPVKEKQAVDDFEQKVLGYEQKQALERERREKERLEREQFEKQQTEKQRAEKERITRLRQAEKEQEKTPPPEKKPTWRERNPDLEKFIGENLFSKIGITILVIGIGFFVRYAIGEGWINEIGRVGIGLLLGGILLFIAHYLRKSFKAFSSVLIGGGIAVLYYTMYLAFQEYHLFTQPLAFALMIVITTFTVVLAIAYDRQEVAVFAILGGFLTPILISTGAGNYKVLFSYITILNVGMLVLAYFKKWQWVNIIAYSLTAILYGLWFYNEIDSGLPPLSGALLFASIFYLIFFAMNVVNNVRQKQKFKAAEITILLSNTFLYYAAGILLFEAHHLPYKGLFTVLIAIFNFAFALPLYRRQYVDRNLVFLLIALVLTFLSLTAPVQLNGNYITLFWAIEALLLLWFWQKSGIYLAKVASAAVVLLMTISLAMDWYNIYVYPPDNQQLQIVLNKGFLTSLFGMASLVTSVALLGKESKETNFIPAVPVRAYRFIVLVLAIGVIYLGFFFEIMLQVSEIYGSDAFTNVVLGAYNFLFLTVLILWTQHRRLKHLNYAALIITLTALLGYFFFYREEFVQLRNNYLQETTGIQLFVFHYVTSAFVLTAVAAWLRAIWQNVSKSLPGIGKVALWFSVFTVVFLLSNELGHIMIINAYQPEQALYEGEFDYMAFYSHIENLLYDVRLVGYPVLWGIASFVLMIIGMQRQMQQLRIISLTLFAITLLKLFILDVWDMSEAGRIIAFSLLGVILLVVSFLYQKLKKFLLETEEKSTDDDTS